MKWKWCLDVIRWHYHNLRAVLKICKCKLKKTIALKRALRLVVAAFPSICTRCKKQNSGTQGNFISVLKLKTKSLKDRKQINKSYFNFSLQTLSMCGGAFFMILINKSGSFHSALFCVMMAMSLNALGNAGTPVTPQDMSPRFAGTLFGKFFFLPLRG